MRAPKKNLDEKCEYENELIEDELILENRWPFRSCNFAEFSSIRGKIETGLNEWLNNVPIRKRYVKELKDIQGKEQFEVLLNELTDEGIFYSMGVSRLIYTPNSPQKFIPAKKNPKGNQPEPGTSIFLYKVSKVLSTAISKPCGLYQNPGMICEGVTISISRIVSGAVKLELAQNIRRHIEKARKIKPFN